MYDIVAAFFGVLESLVVMEQCTCADGNVDVVVEQAVFIDIFEVTGSTGIGSSKEGDVVAAFDEAFDLVVDYDFGTTVAFGRNFDPRWGYD